MPRVRRQVSTLAPTHHYLGYDEYGLTHVPGDTATTFDESMCRPLFGIDQPLSVVIKVMPLDVPVTCLECLVRFTTRAVFYKGDT